LAAFGGVSVERDICERDIRRGPDEQTAAQSGAAAAVALTGPALGDRIFDCEVFDCYLAGDDGQSAILAAAVERIAAAIDGEGDTRLQVDGVDAVRLPGGCRGCPRKFGEASGKRDFVVTGTFAVDLSDVSIQGSLGADIQHIGRRRHGTVPV
jgi:hypothetical protein